MIQLERISGQTPFDIKNAIALLKSNKCSDPNNIFAEHFIHANKKWLSDCFNHIINAGNVPKSLSISTIIPLFFFSVLFLFT